MKTKVAIIICSFLLIGIVGAGLLPFLSNSVGASVEVKEPVFYLNIIEFKETLVTFNESGGASYLVSSGDSRIWETKELNLSSFYDFEADLFLRARTDNESGKLNLSFGYFNSSDSKNEICLREVDLTTSYGDYSITPSCSASNLTDIKKFYWEFSGDCEFCDYRISKGADEFYSRIEISKQ